MNHQTLSQQIIPQLIEPQEAGLGIAPQKHGQDQQQEERGGAAGDFFRAVYNRGDQALSASASGSLSVRLIGPFGCTVEIACL